MKKILALSIALTVLVSCKKEVETALPVTVEEVPIETPVTTECFEGVIKSDTFRMTVRMKGKAFVDGTLSYHFFEKDKSNGTLSGHMVGDTLYADYTFASEGTTSKREVVFLRKGKIFIEGYGDVAEGPEGKMAFKDKKKMYFDSKNILAQIDCKE